MANPLPSTVHVAYGWPLSWFKGDFSKGSENGIEMHLFPKKLRTHFAFSIFLRQCNISNKITGNTVIEISVEFTVFVLKALVIFCQIKSGQSKMLEVRKSHSNIGTVFSAILCYSFMRYHIQFFNLFQNQFDFLSSNLKLFGSTQLYMHM